MTALSDPRCYLLSLANRQNYGIRIGRDRRVRTKSRSSLLLERDRSRIKVTIRAKVRGIVYARSLRDDVRLRFLTSRMQQ